MDDDDATMDENERRFWIASCARKDDDYDGLAKTTITMVMMKNFWIASCARKDG